ncbi:MAG: phosphatidate cytidylyltransferase [Prevotellaceae bacterium]|nr:phosphatidate cytidylyltransferase [Prevotellaceae bacterium]
MSKAAMRNLLTRTLTGIVYVALLVLCSLHPLSSFAFFALVSAATLWEFSTLMNTHLQAQITRPINALSGILLSAAVWLGCAGAGNAASMFALYGFTLIYLLVSELYRKAPDPLKDWSLTFASQVYISLPFALLPTLSLSPDGYTWTYTLALFIFIWVNDTGAYLTGSALHRVFPWKLFERVSPKKSWAGSVGGAVLTLASACVLYRLQPSLSLAQWLGFALTVVVFGTWGDLIESLLKRQLGIKDSGNVLPGHGGLLDRFDSALLAIPAAVIYFALLS